MVRAVREAVEGLKQRLPAGMTLTTVIDGVPRPMCCAGCRAVAETIVDLDGAVSKEPRNRPVIASILAAVDVPLQLGGGIRDMATIEGYLQPGVQGIVIGVLRRY